MIAEDFKVATLILTGALITGGCTDTQSDTYALRWADGTNVTDLHGVRSCLDAFRTAVHQGATPDAVCIPDGPGWRENSPVFRVRPIEHTDLYKGPKNDPLSGQIATRRVDWDTLPPWARGPEYAMRPLR